MQTMSLDEILALQSTDTSGYYVCSECLMPGWDLNNMPCYCDAPVNEARVVGDILAAKKSDRHYRELCESLDKHGVHTPVIIINGMVYNGHHRIAYHTDRGLLDVPVTDSWDEYRTFERSSPW